MTTPAQDATASSSHPQKFMRYRSVRKSRSTDAALSPLPPPAVPPLPPSSNQTSITRLPSRYHRKVKPATEADHTFPPVPTQDQTPVSHVQRAPNNDSSPVQASGSYVWGQTCDGSRQETRGKTSQKSSQPHARSQGKREETSPGNEPHRRSYEAAREEARLILEGETDRLKILRDQEARRQRRERRAHTEQQAERGPAESTSQAHQTNNTERNTDLQSTESSEQKSRSRSTSKSRRLLIAGALALRGGKKHQRALSAIEPPNQDADGSRHDRVNFDRNDQRKSAPSTNLPAYDAPISAVNSGERRVSVKFKDQSITLPVTPSTTCKEILHSASTIMSGPIDAQRAVLLESFFQLGLERPLRRYERVRDVMNSWDNDTQHHLVVMDEADCAAPGLHAADAPSHEPYGATVQLYHSSKPGKWDKRWVKLWENGQVSVSKHESGIDGINICHLSDFDAYTPTVKQIKKLKPPKKFCFALKSQEKSSMFLNGQNFAHFFCTKEKEVADRWYHAVHAWRSWYLVCMLGEGMVPTTTPGVYPSYARPGTNTSAETTPYILGSFKPLNLDLDMPRPYIERREDYSSSKHSSREIIPRPLIEQIPGRSSTDIQRRISVRGGNLAAKSSREFPPRPGSEGATVKASDDSDSGPFTGTGLLARSGTQRSQGGRRSGRGVSGVAGRPLVELEATSEFADGSLLRKMEVIAAQQGGSGPKIDRNKRREITARVGEGF